MQILIHADHYTDGNADRAERYESAIRDSLERFSERLTRVEAHLSDENSDTKSGALDKKCLLETRIAGHQPLAVSHQAPTMDQAVKGAMDKMKHSLDSTLGRLNQR